MFKDHDGLLGRMHVVASADELNMKNRASGRNRPSLSMSIKEPLDRAPTSCKRSLHLETVSEADDIRCSSARGFNPAYN